MNTRSLSIMLSALAATLVIILLGLGLAGWFMVMVIGYLVTFVVVGAWVLWQRRKV